MLSFEDIDFLFVAKELKRRVGSNGYSVDLIIKEIISILKPVEIQSIHEIKKINDAWQLGEAVYQILEDNGILTIRNDIRSNEFYVEVSTMEPYVTNQHKDKS